ncbi:hypothetical protein DPMN_113992 [Dreissena polymorpha]|uniref:Uncharacterized protein n=1 Tax=Dreissena polymorpha TaxID=45954 RepID=A0A9D4QS16_DREPO|nr:hypothetical protein DPMN_113992 [Dreissena polymorpha]
MNQRLVLDQAGFVWQTPGVGVSDRSRYTLPGSLGLLEGLVYDKPQVLRLRWSDLGSIYVGRSS